MPVFKIYTLRKGRHYSRHLPSISWNKRLLSFDFVFHKDCAYSLGNSNHFDYNKLLGIGFGLDHHKNSYRLGWRYDLSSGKIEIAHYYYNNGQREYKTIMFVELGKNYSADIQIDRAGNAIEIDIHTLLEWDVLYNGRIPFSFDRVSRWGFGLFPYFGGDEVAPHDMNISIQKF